jgi:hypothetical protein
MMKLWMIGALVCVVGATGCEKETKQTKEEAAAPPVEAKAPDAAAPACEAVALTKIELPCLNIADNKNAQAFNVLRSAADLDALYASHKGDAPECATPTIPAIDWTKNSVIGVSAMAGGCSVKANTALCQSPAQLKADVEIVMVGQCEMIGYINDFYLVPALAPDAKVEHKFTTRQEE